VLLELLRSNSITGYHIGETYNSPSSLFTLPPLEHAKRRRLWDRAFTPGSLDSYTPFLDSRVSQLISALDTRYRSIQDHDIDLAEWLSFLAIDFMGDFAYGGMFHCLAEGVDRGGIQKIVEDGLGATEIFGAMPWLRPILVTLPTPTSALFDRARSVVQLRKQRGTTVKDLFYYILGEDGRGDIVDSDMDSETLAQEAALAIAAGSDTTSTALANAMFYLITNDCAMDRLRTEVDSAVAQLADSEALLDAAVLGGLPYLHAVLFVTLIYSHTPRD
jgi:cytochrome P450